MSQGWDLSRRELLAAVPALAAAQALKPQAKERVPVAVASSNGLQAVAEAVARMEQGALPVDAAVAGVSLVEADPDDVTVGFGGLPNEEGVVQLDAAVMDGVTMRAGAVAALEGIKHPSQVALTVMRRTTRVLLVGEGAKKFALAHGFREENLLTERARKIWLFWKENAAPEDDWLPDPKEVEDPDIKWFITRFGDRYFRPTGTIHLSAVDGQGRVGCCTTTSGLYCDPEVGSAGATGHGESNITVVGAHTVVEFMRQGKSPEEACLATLERVVRNTREAYLKDEKGRPKNNLTLYAVNVHGEVGAASIWSGAKYALARGGSKPQLVDAAFLFRREAR